MAKNEKAIVQVIAKENDTTAVMKEVHKASDIEENDIISIKLNEENSGEIDEIIMLGKVLAHEVEECSEKWDATVVQEAKSVARKITNNKYLSLIHI